MSEPPFAVGDKVTTDYTRDQAGRVRTVVSVQPNTITQTRWWVRVAGIDGFEGKGIDSAWFTKVKDEA